MGSGMGLDLLQRLRQQEQVSAFAVHVAGAVLPDRAGAAVRPPDQHRQSWLAIRHRGLPRRTHCPLWTRNGLGFPVDVKVFLGEAGPSLGARVLTDRPDDGHRMLHRCVVHRLGRDVAAAQEVLGRGQLLAGQRGMDALDDADVLFRGRCGDDLHDEMRLLLIAGLGLMVLVPDPFNLAGLMTEPGLRVVR